MTGIDKIEQLSVSEKNVLEEDLGLLKHVVKYGSILLPLLLIITFLSWAYDWHSFFKFLSTCLSIIGSVALAGAFAQGKNLRYDLKSNVKTITHFVLDKKIIEGYVSSTLHDSGGINDQKVKRKITVADTDIREAVNYRIENKKKQTAFPFKTEIDAYEKVLKYTYTFKVREENKEAGFIIPVEYYLVANEGETIIISYAKKSKKVFKIENAFDKTKNISF